MIDVPVEVKDALRDGRLRKNYRFNVLNSDGTTDFTIDNDTLVSESVSIDERMCSGDTIKFGLCEGSSLEFQYFNHENITDRQIQAFIDIDYGEDVPYSIPMGFFTVKKCSRQASTGIIKVTAYNKLQSDYLDAKANQMLLDDFEDDPSVEITMYDIQKHLLANYAIIEAPKEAIDLPGVPVSKALLIDSNNLSFGVLSDYDTPLSLYSWEHQVPYSVSTLPTVNLAFASDAKRITITSGQYWEIGTRGGDLQTLIDNIREYLIDIIYEAKLTKNGTELTKAQIESIIAIFGIGTVEFGNQTYKLNYNVQQVFDTINNVVNRTATTLTISLLNSVGFFYNNTVSFPVKLGEPYTYSYYVGTGPTFWDIETKTRTPNILDSLGNAYTADVSDYFGVDLLQLSDAEKTTYTIGDMPDFTLREIMTATYETVAQFGQLDRVTDLFSGVELNRSRLLPLDALYPDNALYPNGAAVSSNRSMYSKLWADEGNIHKWRYLIITYKGLDANNNEADFTLQRTINADGTDDYNCSDNWLFRNLVWTAEDVGAYADAMVAKMQDITWFPFEMWCSGLPYLETGDEIEIPLGEDSYTSYVLQRQLKGIQNLQDTYINGTLDIF